MSKILDTDADLEAAIAEAEQKSRAEGGRPLSAVQQHQEQPPSNPKSYTLLRAEDAATDFKLEWAVKNIVPARGIGQTYGASTSAKTFLLMNLSFALTDGEPFFGYKVKKTPVVYVCLEGEAGFKKRIKGHLEYRHRPSSKDLYFIIGESFALDDPTDVEALASVCPRGSMVIVDTQNASCPYIKENATDEMGRLIQGAKNLARLIDGFVMLVAHTGKDTSKGARGSSVQLPAWDCCLEVERRGKKRSWKAVKVKDAEETPAHHFRLGIIDLGRDEDGDPITTAVAIPDDDFPDRPSLTKAEEYALESLKAALEQTNSQEIYVEDWRPVFYAGHTAAKQDSKRTAFDRARKALHEKKQISVNNDHYRIIS